MPSRLLKIVAGFVVAAAAGWLFYHFRLWERDWSAIDEGWASLIGSAMGSFLAVVGALYVSKAEERRKRKEFEEFVKVAVQNLVVQASYLEAMAREPHKIAPTPEVQAGIISIQLRNLTDALAVFDKEIAGSRDGDYALRQRIVGLDAMLAESRPELFAEPNIADACHHWHVGAYQVRHHATTFLEAFGWPAPIPTTNLITSRVKAVIESWKSWNIPVSSQVPGSTSAIHSQNQPLHQANA